MRNVWKYALGAYFALVLLGSTASGSPLMLLMLIVIVAVVVGRRASETGVLRLSWTAAPPVLPSAPRALPAAGADVRRLRDGVRDLQDRFPENPLESAQLVEVLSAYTHEPDEARRVIEDEYDAHRSRFLAWREEIEALDAGGGARPAAEVDRLAAELTELRRYVDELDRRAAASDALLDRALRETGRAEDALARARESYARLAASRPDETLAARLGEAEEKLQEARRMFTKDAERPVSALRLCGEAVDAATQVEQEARSRVEQPRELHERLARFEAERVRVEQELARVRDDFQASAEMYAPSCWLEVRGAGAAADRALARARARHETASRALGSEQVDTAALELEEAFGALERASELAAKIGAHLAALEAAALSGRERIAEAEKETDRAWTALRTVTTAERAGREGSLERAADLADRARTEIEKQRPDWLTVVELADRSAELARATWAAEPPGGEQDAELEHLLEETKERAKASLDSARAWAIVASDLTPPTLSAIGSAEVAFQAALTVEAAIPQAGSRPERARAVETVIDAFRSAERTAAAASDAAETERSASSEKRVVGFGAARSDGGSAEAVVWGALGLAALLADD